MHARQRGPVRTILVSLLVAAVALVPLPGHAAEPVRASCEFPAGGLFMMEGDSLPAEVAFTNDSDHAVVFRVVMRENFHYGPEHVVLSHVLGEGRAHQAEIDLGPAYGLGLGPADIVLDVETSDTGETAIATCTVTVRVLPLPDSDGDGLPDEWETKGIDYDKDGDVDFALHEEAVDPERKDVFVELDAMLCDRSDPATSFCRRPRTISPEAVGRAQWEFAEQGIALHVDRDVDPVSEIRFLRFDTKGPGGLDDFDDLKIGYPERPCDGTFGTRADRESSNCENILGAKRLVYHYGILAHALADRGTTSGYAETGDDSAATVADALRAGTALPGGNDFVITLGAWTDEMIARNGGLSAVQAGVFLHELGHNLGLQHGGADPINCKPHYLSVMNYLYQFPANLSQRTPDFQDEERGTLNEKGGLDETVAAVPGTENEVEPKSVVYGVGGVRHSGYADAAADWNGDGQYQTGVTADINHVRLGEDTTSCPASPDQTLSAWNDWEHARYNFRQSRMFADGAHKGASGAAGDEITGEAALSLNSPIDLAVTATVDKAEAGAGDTLTYTATATNKGPAAARRVALTGTPPDGPAVNRPLPDLAAGAEATETFTYTIPCGTPDAATLTGKVQVTGTNEYGSPEQGTLGDNTATASTTVRRPVLEVTATAAPAGNAGEAIGYTLAYRNTGGGPVTSATVTATLPAETYYSPPLDQGAGPRPDAVVRDADGTTTLRWDTGPIAAGAAAPAVAFTARPGLLHPEGATVSVPVSVRFADGGCSFTPAATSASTRITTVAPTRDPMLVTLWSLLPGLRTPEALARVQATDTRFDADADGALSQAEVADAFRLPLLQPRTLRAELLATYLNLATRRIDAGTAIDSLTARRLGLHTVRDAVRHARAALARPPHQDPLGHTAATVLLVEINSGVAARY